MLLCNCLLVKATLGGGLSTRTCSSPRYSLKFVARLCSFEYQRRKAIHFVYQKLIATTLHKALDSVFRCALDVMYRLATYVEDRKTHELDSS